MLQSLSALPLLCLSLTAVAASAPISDQLAKRINADVQTILQRTGTPGATILIAEHGHVVYRQAYGLRDREHHVPATVDSYYEIGSITKQFTAAAILQLQEAGKLHLDDKLSTYLPNAPHAGEITLRHAAKAVDKSGGPGSLLEFGVALDKAGKVASISLG